MAWRLLDSPASSSCDIWIGVVESRPRSDFLKLRPNQEPHQNTMEIHKLSGACLAAALICTTTSIHADEAKTTPLLTALSATTISGYVDTSAIWNPGTGNANPAPFAFNVPSKRDGFNVDTVALNIEKPLS